MSDPKGAVPSSSGDRANARNALIAGFLGWTLDSFDYFILTFVLVQIGGEFHRSVVEMSWTITSGLLARPIGAVIFGLMADRYGRRLPLMIDVLLFSIFEVLCGFAPTYRSFLILRLLFGVCMGGEWGVGASLAMESVPVKWRGTLSGLLQEGYALGFLLASIAFWTVFPRWGWRPMFFIGGLPALLVLFIRAKVKESDAWKAEAAAKLSRRGYWRAVAAHWKRFIYLTLLIASLAFMSHGTQDFYPTFLQLQRHFSPQATAIVNAISMVGAIIGGIVVGLCSDRFGRRRAMITSALLGIPVIPLWMFGSPTIALAATGAFVMQFMVQGAWAVVPAHINELSPGALRGFFPGLAYQLGVVIAAGSATIEAALGRHFTYAQAMGGFAAVAFVVAAIVIAAGPEAHGVPFGSGS
ncbi:MAG: MFS transporter [Candidatus Acidiferrales bacterium]